MQRKPARARAHVDYAEASEEAISRSEQSRKSSGPKLYQIAKVIQLATDEAEGGSSDDGPAAKLEKVDSGILSRIQKSLRLAKHPGTGEAEARQALRLATRLMASQNLTQADLIASEDAETVQTRAGMSEVEIVSPTGSMVRNESWANRIAVAINLFFSVKAYSTSHAGRAKLTWTFYGLAVNTVAAASAFEMVHNQVLTWAADNKNVKGRTGKNSYCQGVAAGLVDMAKKENKAEMQRAIDNEKKRLEQAARSEKEERAKQIDRLRGPPSGTHRQERKAKIEDATEDEEQDVKPIKRSSSVERDGFRHDRLDVKPPPYQDEVGRDHDTSDEDEFYDAAETDDFPGLSSEMDVKPDFDEELEKDIIDLTQDTDAEDDKRNIKVELKTEAGVKREEDDEPAEQANWRDSGQLIRFRQDAEKIADDYLQRVHGKLKLKKRAATTYRKDTEAYEKGRRDAKKIDVKRRRIEG